MWDPRSVAGMWMLAAVGVCAQVPGVDLRPGHAHPLGLGDDAGIAHVVDLDGDGRPDVLGRDLVWIAGADGVFVPTPSLTPLASPASHAVGDLDGDGDLDVFNSDLVALNDGTGVFTRLLGAIPPLPPPVCGFINVFTHPVIADFDGDGDADVFAPEQYGCGVLGGIVHMFVNDGTGRLSLHPSPVPGTAIEPTFTVALDIDFDGDVDVVMTTAIAMLTFFNDGTGTFSAGPPLGSGSGADRAITADFDGDGVSDILMYRPGVFEIVRRMPGGSFTWGTVSAPADVTGLEAVDLDLDGKDELVLAQTDGVSVHAVGAGPAPQELHRFHVANRAAGRNLVVAGDLDDDGDEDLVIQAEFRTHTLLSDGAGGLEELGRHDLGVVIAIPGAVGDFDLDGDVDLVGREPLAGGGHRIGLLANDGRGRFGFVQASWTTVPGPVGSIAHVFDANGDAFPDIYLAAESGNSAPDLVLVNVGTGWIISAVITGSGGTTRIADGDLDGDGDDDIVLARGEGVLLDHLIVENLGGGSFAPPRSLAPIPLCGTDLAIGDVDGDGDLDVLVTCTVFLARLYFNDGAGNFTLGHTFGTLLARAASLADFDGDGDLDAVVNRDIWENDGTGSFSFRGHLAPAGTPSPNRPFDVDGDGDVDLVGLEGDVFLNHGGFTFTRQDLAAWARPGHDVPLPELADLDRDGDLDAVVDGHVYNNLDRQLSGRGRRELGDVLFLDVHAAAPGVIYWLFASVTPADVPVPPFGRLFVDPAATVLFAAGSVPATGRASVPAPVPNNPAIAGVEVLWQAITTDGIDTRFSNLHGTVLRP